MTVDGAYSVVKFYVSISPYIFYQYQKSIFSHRDELKKSERKEGFFGNIKEWQLSVSSQEIVILFESFQQTLMSFVDRYSQRAQF